jgi:FeS assembly protein IscX
VERAAELLAEDVVSPVDTQETHEPLHWQDFARLVRVLNTAYPDAEPLDLTLTKLFKMILQLPGFEDDPDAVGEDQLEKLQMAWHEIRSG